MSLKVLLWSPKGAGLHYGGPGMSAYRLYNSDNLGRFKVSLVHGTSAQEHYNIFQAQHHISSIKSDAISQLKFIHIGNQWLKSHAQEFDIFHGLQGFHLTIKPALQAQHLGLPSVVKLAAYKSDLATKSDWKAVLGLPQRRRKIIEELSGVIAISQDIVHELLEYGIPESKIAYIPNGVDTDIFYPVRDQVEKRELRQQFGWLDLPTILFVGDINQRKQPHLLVEAVGEAKARGYDCQLVLVGPQSKKDYVSEMKSRITSLGIESQVVWFGFTKNVASLYRASDIFCLLSTNEGLPNALLEAMASGLPSIGTFVSGITDLIVDGKNGSLCSPDLNKITETLLMYLSNPYIRKSHGQAAREKVLAEFSTNVVLNAHENLFRYVISGKDISECSVIKNDICKT